VAVSRGARAGLGRQGAGGSRPILYYHGLPERLAERCAMTREAVGISAGRERHDDLDRSLRSRLRQRRRSKPESHGANEQELRESQARDLTPLENS
jgi:hypothetical protein